jgi:hypothetical protein
MDACGGVFNRRHGRVQVEVAPIILHRGCFGEREEQIPGRFVRHLADGTGNHLLTDQMRGLTIFAVENQLPHFRQGGARLWIDRVIRAAGPERVFVQLKPFVIDAAEDHRAEPAIADGEGFGPFFGRLTIPKAQGFGGRGGRSVERGPGGAQSGAEPEDKQTKSKATEERIHDDLMQDAQCDDLCLAAHCPAASKR